MPIADLTERQQALDIRNSYIVQAPAGSGKTGVLTLRILTLLTVVDKPEDILAITFTRKAAAEMRVRVMEALDSAASSREPDNEYDRQFYWLAKQVLERDHALNWGLQQNQNRLHLQTIDSFCSSIVRNRPLSSGLGVQFGVAEDPAELYSEAAQECLKSLDETDALGDALRRVLGFLDNQYQKLEGMLCQMLAQRDHWLQDVTDLHSNPEQLRLLLEQSLFNINRDARDQFFDLYTSDFQNELESITAYAANQLALAGSQHPILNVNNPEHQSEFDSEKTKLSLFVTKAKPPKLRARFDKRDGFPTGTGAEKKAASEYKARANAFVQRMESSGEPGLTMLLDFISLPSDQLDQNNWQLLQDLMLIVRYSAAHLKLVFSQKQQVDFSEIALAALTTLGEPDAPNDVALILDASISHILIDEFQDTSFIQIELLERLTAGWERGDGRSLFLVGDPMQSIYAFRQADVGLFLRLWKQQALGTIELTPLLLSTNFRSSATIIRWINATFHHCFPSQSDQRKGAVTYAPSVAAKAGSENDGVSVDFFRVSSESDTDTVLKATGIQAEADWIADRIAEVRSGQTIAILVKGKNHVLPIAAVLRQRGIPFQAVEIEPLQQSQVVSDLMALARAAWSPNDKIAWFALLRGPWCGVSLQELEQLVALDPVPWVAMRKLLHLDTSPFTPETHRKLSYMHTCFLNAFEQRHRRVWSENLYRLMLEMGLPAAFADESALQVIDVFFDLLNRIDYLADVPDFARLQKKLSELYVPPDNFTGDVQPVQIMSMHKSKGLEFDVVFLPQLQRKSRADDKPLILIDKQTSLTSKQQELFVAPLDVRTSNEYNSVYRYLWELNKQRSRNEACRLLYVAATRARQRLFLSGIVVDDGEGGEKKPDSNSLLALLWPRIEDISGVATHQVEAAESRKVARFFRVATPQLFTHLGTQKAAGDVTTSDSAVYIANADSESLSVEASAPYRREAGILVHRILEQWVKSGATSFMQNSLQQQEFLRLELTRGGVSDQDLNAACALVRRALDNLHQSKYTRWLFLQSHEDSHAELPLTHVTEQQIVQHLVIDRTFVENGIRYIIDYKLSEPGSESGLQGQVTEFLEHESGRYRDQLYTYKAAMNAIKPMETRTYLYFPLIDQLQEVIF
ncbi:AAA family ATPase [Ketobacter sp. MCCC 1A13808]|uniref:UvrD-helicase domain-containing protein n=1 Tax=Ketobacter sp. MCCC 1A13808 TaxID=2602738 RepID=UPI000F1B59BA|nr:UvrD-helicase domain-containing protein [Ketobacter sp. MCCC 1A13808]MVF12409.1 AAA family ATPase [Ketobacter sp. MCCC 1A13808]RLP55776.1 MAG: hypothetical protein D6160_05125 [Ketobacter sp.]